MIFAAGGAGLTIVAYIIRIVAVGAVLVFVAVFMFSTGWITFSPERPGLARHKLIDWGCPTCDVWSTAYVSPLWRTRARRRALGLLHKKLSPRCPASDQDLLILP